MFTRVIVRTSLNNSLISPLRCSAFSSTVSPEPNHTNSNENVDTTKINNFPKRTRMIQAVFTSLQRDGTALEIKTPFTDSKLEKAKTIDQLLSVSEGSGVSRHHALKVLSILSNWSTSGKVQMTEFENDPRFLRLCRVLTSSQKFNRMNQARNDDLSVVLKIAADDEAAQLIGNISVPQMVKVITTLSIKKRRSMLLLRTLAFNITKSSQRLNLKQSSDVLYGIATLNFLDENLLTKISNDICLELENFFDKSAVIGSILTSIGLIKYKNPVLLDTLSDWILNNHSKCRSQDIFSLLMTLAILNFNPTNSDKLFEVLLPYISEAKSGKFLVWLEIVWSLVLLNKVNHEQISGVFEETMLRKFQENTSFSTKLRLLNIDAAAQYLIPDYKGPRLPETSVLRNIIPSVPKDKTELVDSVIDTLKNLIKSEQLLKTHVDTGLGFIIDAECLLDNKCKPIPLDSENTTKNVTRVAVIVQDFHDMTIGKVEPTGISALYANLLKARSYKILNVPYTEFRSKDNLIERVKYIEAKLKTVVNS